MNRWEKQKSRFKSLRSQGWRRRSGPLAILKFIVILLFILYILFKLKGSF